MSQKVGGMWTDPIWESVFRASTFAAMLLAGLGIVCAFVSAWVGYEITDATQKEAARQIIAADQRTAALGIELEKARAETARADANLLGEQRLTARERMRLERVERAVLPRSLYVDWQKLVAGLRNGHFQPVNVAVIGGWEAQDFGANLLSALAQAGMGGRLIDAPSDLRVQQRIGHTSTGVEVLTANSDGQRFAEFLWRGFRIGGGSSSISFAPSEWTALPRDTNCLIVEDNGWAMAPSDGQPGEGLDKFGRPVPAPQ